MPQAGATPSRASRASAYAIPVPLTIMSTEQNPPTIDTKALKTTLNIQVFNSDGGMVQFGDIFADQKTIVVFIRAYTPLFLYVFP